MCLEAGREASGAAAERCERKGCWLCLDQGDWDCFQSRPGRATRNADPDKKLEDEEGRCILQGRVSDLMARN